MITGSHVIIYSRDAEADRGFIRDVLGFPHVDVGGGWLIFKVPPCELGIHPTDGAEAHEFYLMCDDVHATVADLTAKGVSFASEVTDAGFGLETVIKLPGGGTLRMYEPRHATAI